MISYPYIKDLFQGILAQSDGIQGRFHISYRYGAQEINSDELGELGNDIQVKKYPLSLMPPPHSRGTFTDNMKGEWERFRIIIFFVKTSFYGTGTTPNPKTQTATHTVDEDWHDMKRCAISFYKMLQFVQRSTRGSKFRIPDNMALCVPVSGVGTDRASGVRFDFDFDLYIGCSTDEDYPTFTIPTIEDDSHPKHDL